MKIYVVMSIWTEYNYYADENDVFLEKVFISKEKAQKYCDEENKHTKEAILEDLEIPYSGEELEEIMIAYGYYKTFIKEIELEDAGTSL